jgi:hypothetical protein
MSYISAHQASLRLKMQLSQYAWFSGCRVSTEYGETILSVSARATDAGIQRMIDYRVPSVYMGYNVRVS